MRTQSECHIELELTLLETCRNSRKQKYTQTETAFEY